MNNSVSEMERQIKIAIAEHHPIMRKGIRDIITSGYFNIQIEVGDGESLLNELRSAGELPDICLMDMSMPGLNGYDLLTTIRKSWNNLKILVFSEFYDKYSTVEMLRKGANGYLKKSCSPQELQKALALIYYDDYYYTEETSKSVLSMHHNNGATYPKITEREMQFLQLCCSEAHYKEIAQMMGVSTRTVEAFRNSLFDKLNLKTRTGLALFAVQNGIVPISK